jgi:hypothetical protein
MDEIKTRDLSGVTRYHHRKDTGTLRLGKWQRFSLTLRNVLDITEPSTASYSRKQLGKKRAHRQSSARQFLYSFTE